MFQELTTTFFSGYAAGFVVILMAAFLRSGKGGE